MPKTHVVLRGRNNGLDPCDSTFNGPPGDVLLTFEGSFDGSRWFIIGAPIVQIQAIGGGEGGSRRYYSGAYPFLRVNLQAGDFTNCRYDVHYSGSLSGTFQEENLSAGDQGFITYRSSPAAGIAAGVTQIAGGVTGLRPHVYAVAVNVQAGSTLPTGVKFCDTITCLAISWQVGNLIAGDQYILPFTGKAWFASSELGTGLHVENTAAGGCSTCTLDVVLRYE